MQLVRFAVGDENDRSDEESWGVLTGDGVRDVGSLLGTCPTMWDLVQDWSAMFEQLPHLVPDAPLRAEPRLLSPLPERGKVICIGLNYRDHALETGAEIPTEPVVFNKLAGALCGPDDEVPLPSVSQQVDFEAELVLVIGREARNVSEQDAEQYVLGYMCGHDVSARDWQKGRPGGQWLLGKSFPNFAPTGPVLVPRQHVEDVNRLRITLTLNGETLQDSTTAQLIFKPTELIAYLSQCCVLQPGDMIFTGTPPGVGAARQPPRFLQSGDVCTVEIEGLGKLTNRFV